MSEAKINLSKYRNILSCKHQAIRFIWSIVWVLFAGWLPRSLGSGWKRFLLRIFGAKIDATAVIYSSARIYYPANLIMEHYSCLASEVNCYNVALVKIGANSTISQGAYLCTASHDITNPLNPLITAPIVIEDQAWVATGAFVGMGVTVRQGAVVGACAAVFRDVEPWTVVGGNPAKFIKRRVIQDA
ncbi:MULTISPECIES: putative colanic acid biosynthesis acetyltransferase [unclassified Dysgonomonas]|jgi:putative colanic acid biosynthesis acetyltransferase WcaF|uniref:putative colanic acid biosynthesis acetyltransferase n=1 Tax=unclassified Dysgonomonas TaxID=2630389 RepID=UPI0025B9CB32|nr:MULTISPECIES: putative colanic acid biosynthesis acetyltransferase [unclassified Dysgonomonas]MDR2002593.1 putative colanic acid biosynthesis acetyltransferase [Prevotella sp.]HMM01892.1 putative colanic acid biosynthesis acetyltransferase [Dysgonomonas sp.]